MENELLFQLGIDWPLILSQMVNFGVLLIILTLFVYKPVIKIIKQRNAKIKEGLEKAEEADVRLKEVDVIGKEKIKQAEQESVGIIKATEKKAKVLDQELQKKNEEKQLQMQKDLHEMQKKQQEEMKNMVLGNAVELVKKTLIKTVELKPEAVDEALIKKAALEVGNEK